MKAWRSSVSASARRILRIVERRHVAVDDEVGADAGLAHGALRLRAHRGWMFFSSGTVTSVGKVMSNLPLANDSMRVERSAMMVNSMPSR